MKLKGYLFGSDGVPVEGATVTYYTAIEGTPTSSLGNTTTDSNGMWTFTGLTAGSYDVKTSYTVNGTSQTLTLYNANNLVVSTRTGTSSSTAPLQ